MDSLLEALNSSDSFQNGMPNPQFALLNFFFPGFSVFQRVLHTYLGIDLNFYIPLLVAIFGLNFLWNYISGQVWSLVGEYLMSSFRVRTDDEIYNMLMLWISRQRFSQNSRNFLVNTDIYSRSSHVYGPDDSDSEEDGGSDNESGGLAVADGSMIIAGKQNLHFTPSFGSHRFWYKGWPLMFERIQNSQQINFQSASEREELSISCYGRNPQILKDILQEARQMYLKKDERKTLIFRGMGSSYGDPYWQRTMTRPNRPFSTVVLDEKLKQGLVDDISDYIHPATRRWYSNRGIPYRRGYLLHGPPGTGKSSLSLALAGYFRMAIYIVSLSSLTATEEGLTSLFSMLPNRCLVLLEDIDTAGLTHTRDQPDSAPEATAATPSSAQPNGTTTNGNPGTGRLSLSGLLNILDGVASKEGRILVMTTNHVEKLDKALIRPGRVDLMVPFQLADRAMTQSIFRAIYAPYEGELTSPGEKSRKSKKDNGREEVPSKIRETVTISWEKEHAEVIERVARLAEEFASKIPELEFSPAEVQGLLLRHKRSPEEAIRDAEEWVKQTRKEKKEKALQEAEKRRKEQEEEKEKEKKEKEEKEKEEKEEKEKKAKEEEEEEEEEEKKKKKKKLNSESESKDEQAKVEGTKADSVEVVKEGEKGGDEEEGKSDTQDEEKKKPASDSDYEKV
ncbi:putative mitochondrial chaperone [Escovopsis weberi]|uniref:Putative mitochondrial chaperone n=1 Tax=Escovopsis weberi TaxID=150374 RepID=A0A0M8N9V0_ESCWE|nr:putative mitochondrial chaperone [Escovopsis weberi]